MLLLLALGGVAGGCRELQQATFDDAGEPGAGPELDAGEPGEVPESDVPGGGAGTGGSRMGTGGNVPAASGGAGTGRSVGGTGGAVPAATGGAKPASPTSTGGAPGTGGAKATGGAQSTGGVKATGGTTSTGGITSTGGMSNNGSATTGGAKATGGSQSTGGAQGTGGASSCTGATSPCNGGKELYNFEAGIAPWTLYLTSPTRLMSATRISHAPRGGEGNLGGLQIEAPFDGANQKVELQDTQPTPLDARGRTFRAKVRLGSGLSDDTAHPGAIKLFAKSGPSYDYASGAWTNLLAGGGWVEVTLVADHPDFTQGAFSSNDVRQIGFELRVFAETLRPTAAVVFLDSIWF